MGLYCAMISVTVLTCILSFGNGMAAGGAGYFDGALGGGVISIVSPDLVLTKNQIVAGVITFAVF